MPRRQLPGTRRRLEASPDGLVPAYLFTTVLGKTTSGTWEGGFLFCPRLFAHERAESHEGPRVCEGSRPP